ncbi:MAG: RNA polymerase sigma factor [Lewinella sp.]
MPKIWAAFTDRIAGSDERLFRKHYQALYRYAFRITGGDDDMSRDLIQTVFIHLFEKRDSLPKKLDAPEGYLLRMLGNELTDQRRKAVRTRTISLSEESEDGSPLLLPNLLVTAAPNIEEMLILRETTDERQRQLVAALTTLSPAQREIILLRFYQQLSYPDIEALTGLRYQSIRNYLSQGLRRLRKEIKKT